MLGVLTLDTAFPRIAGDIGAAETFPFPVRHAVVRGAGVHAVVHEADARLVPAFVAAAQGLASDGCIAITTTCGFLVRWQDEIARAVDVPVLTSALVMLSLVARCVGTARPVGVVTYSAQSLTAEVLAAAGADPVTPVAGVEPHGYFAATIRDGAATLDRARMAADVVSAAQALAAARPDIGAIVLECANMPPYRDAVAGALRIPVFDMVDLVSWFYAGAARRAPAHVDRDLW